MLVVLSELLLSLMLPFGHRVDDCKVVFRGGTFGEGREHPGQISSLLFLFKSHTHTNRILTSNCEYALSTMTTIGVFFMHTVLAFSVYNG